MSPLITARIYRSPPLARSAGKMTDHWTTKDGQRKGAAFPSCKLEPEDLAQAEEPQQPAHSSGMPHPHSQGRPA